MKKRLILAVMSAAAGASQAVVLTALSAPVASVLDTTTNAVAAAGSFSGNDTATVQDTLDTLSANFGSYVQGGTTAWGLWDKTDSADGSQTYTFTGNPQTPTGTLNFNASITGWFAVTLKSGSQFSMYLFDGGTAGISSIDYSTLGTSLNKKGTAAQDLSHASLWGGTAPVTPPVPEPETYALFLAGLAVVGFMGRRHAQR